MPGRGGNEPAPKATTALPHLAPDPDEAAAEAAKHVARAATRAFDERGRFLLAISGGRTPARLFRRLADVPDLPWHATHVFWADERCVPPDHEASNYRLARAALLDHVGVPSGNVHRIRGEVAPPVAAGAYRAELATFFGSELPEATAPTFDLVLLGIGTDGHTASLFPGGRGLSAPDWALDVNAPPSVAPRWRVTLTLAALRTARRAVVLATGADKAEVVGRIFRRRGRTPPAGLVTAIEGVTWVLDVDAGAELPDRG